MDYIDNNTDFINTNFIVQPPKYTCMTHGEINNTLIVWDEKRNLQTVFCIMCLQDLLINLGLEPICQNLKTS